MQQAAPLGSTPCEDLDSAPRTFALRRSQSHDGFQLVSGEDVLAQDESLDLVIEQLGAHLTLHIAEYSPDYVFVHAGVVAWHGRALILPGVSFAGKSTLVAELVRRGASYYSDEFAVIDRDGRVHPFPRDLRFRRPGETQQKQIPLDQLGRAGTESVPVALVVFTEFKPDAHWDPQPLSPGRAALEMMLHTFPVQRTPARVLETFAAAFSHAQAWRTVRGDASEAATALLSALETGAMP
jgi:hypothetical protein